MPGFLGGSSAGTSGTGGEITFPKEFVDPVTKLRISNPENLIDTDFEYGLQPTKWETVELINNTPSFFSKSGDTTIPGIVSVTTNAGTREITVTTALDHGLDVGIPINVQGSKSLTADGAFIINSIPNTRTFTYLAKGIQDETLSIEDLYTSIITGEFFQGSQIRISDADGIVTDGEAISTLTVTTESPHGFGVNTPFYFLNLNSTISQEFEAANTAAKSFDSSNSATAQTFDGSNTLSTFNIDWSNSATIGGVVSNVSAVSTVENTITVVHTTETFQEAVVGTPLYYDVLTSTGVFNVTPRGVVFVKELISTGANESVFTVSAVPDGTVISIDASIAGTFQLANQARIFAGNNINTTTEYSLDVYQNSPNNFDGANDTGSVSTVSIYSGQTIQMQNNAGSDTDPGLYVGAMVLYETNGSAASGLTNSTTYFVRSISTVGGLPGLVQITIGAFPDSASAITISGGTGTQTFRKIGVSVDKDIFHVPSHDYILGDLVRYDFPENGAVSRTVTSPYMYVQSVYEDGYNIVLKDTKGTVATGLTEDSPGESAVKLKSDWGYETNGVYYILVNGVSEPVYCIMDSNIDGGGWMMMMKATRGSTFRWGASYWTANNTLNPTQVNRNNGDAKFNVMNYWPTKDILAIWPDIGQGGSLSRSGYNWIWLQNNWWQSGQRIVPITLWGSVDRLFFSDALSFSGWGSSWSTQSDVRFYGFNYRNNPGSSRTRWGFGWNENGGGRFPSGDMNSDDVTGGIGINRTAASAGDFIYCCQNRSGMNRTARVELYVR